jgi:hypothetical protein
MPIDRDLNAEGLRVMWRKPDESMFESKCGCAWRIQGAEEHPDFVRWLPAFPGAGRQDYAVNSDGKLIRLGNQIDEELYPSRDLEYVSVRGSTAPMSSSESVSAVEDYAHFSHWADTPKNRELGLYKEKEEPMSTKFKVGDRVKVTHPNYLGQSGRLEVFVPKMNGRAPGWRIRTDKSGDLRGFFADSLELVSSEFEIGDKVRVTCLDNHQGHVGEVVGYLEVRCSAGDHPGCSIDFIKGGEKGISYCFHSLESVPRTPAQHPRSHHNSLVFPDPVDNKKMVDTQSKSLMGFEQTSWLQAKMPDGRVVESPMPLAKDGWEETWSETWKEDECGVCTSIKPKDQRVDDAGDHPYGTPWLRISDVFTDEPIEMPIGHDGLRAWFHDMAYPIYSSKKIGHEKGCDVYGRAVVLKAKVFRREIEESNYRRGGAIKGYVNFDYEMPLEYSGEKFHAVVEGQKQQATALQRPNPAWPDRHPRGPLKVEK